MSTTIGEVNIAINFEQKALEKSIKSTEKNVDSVSKSLGSKFSLGSSLMQAAVTKGFDIASDGAISFAKSIVDTGISFDRSMSSVGALSRATGDDLQALRDKAIEMGRSMRFK